MAQQIQLRYDSATNWTSANPTLAIAELGIENDTDKIKIGDGLTAWNSLAYWSSGGTASPLTTKGDLFTFDTDNARLPVGSNGQVLEADSTQTLGIKWATPSTNDSDAIHDNVNGEINAITEKTSPANDDIVIIEDSANSYSKKKVKISNLPSGGTASPLTTKGDLYGYSTTNDRIPVGSNGQVLQADSTQALGLKWATPSSGGSGTNRNYLINGNFDVSQRGTIFDSTTSPANNDDTYLLDRWNLISDGNNIFDVAQEVITDLEGSNYAIKLDVETSARGGIVQILENKDTALLANQYVTLSFKVKSANIADVRAAVLSWAGTADSVTSDVVSTWAATPTWSTNWTEENTPSDLTVTSSWTTVTVENIFLDSATINNLAVVIWTPNAETIGDIVYISQIKLEISSTATAFIPRTYAEELTDCQRYFMKFGGGVYIFTGFVFTTTTARFNGANIRRMRIKPTMTIVGTAELYDGGTPPNHPITSSSLRGSTDLGYSIDIVGTGFNPGNGCQTYLGGPNFFEFDAEM